MKYSVTISIPGGHLSLEMDSQKQVFDELSFWQSLPEYCPIDGSKVRLNSRDAHTAKKIAVVYYELVSTGEFPYRGYIGQNVEGGTLFHDGTWRFYDGQAETVVWRDGRMVVDLNKLHGRTSPFIRLENKIKMLFKADAKEAERWLILRYTRRRTPADVREYIVDLTGEECEAIWAALNDKPESYKATFAADVAAQGQSSGK